MTPIHAAGTLVAGALILTTVFLIGREMVRWHSGVDQVVARVESRAARHSAADDDL